MSKDNNSDNSSQSEKAIHMSPGISYKIHFKSFHTAFSYNYVMAEHEGTGDNSTDLDFDIHKLGIRFGLDYQLSDQMYLLGYYRYTYGIESGLDDRHYYNGHTIGAHIVIQFGESKTSSSSKEPGRSSDRKKGKRSKLFDFFDVY